MDADEEETADCTAINLSYRLTSAQVALLNNFDNPAFSYALEYETAGPALFDLDDLRVDLLAVPEPGTARLLALSATGMLLARRQRRDDVRPSSQSRQTG